MNEEPTPSGGFLNVTHQEFSALKEIFTGIPGNEDADAIKALNYLGLNPVQTIFKVFTVRIVDTVCQRITPS